jgi:hypothetical protein
MDLIEVCNLEYNQLKILIFSALLFLLTFTFWHYKVDKASMLDEAIEYLKTLQLQVQVNILFSFSDKLFSSLLFTKLG